MRIFENIGSNFDLKICSRTGRALLYCLLNLALFYVLAVSSGGFLFKLRHQDFKLQPRFRIFSIDEVLRVLQWNKAREDFEAEKYYTNCDLTSN